MNERKEDNGRRPRASVARGTAIVGSLTLVSRVLGAVRDLLTARLFGAGPIADCFFVAFRIPNLLRSFVAEGAMTSAFVPVFADELKKGGDHAAKTMRSVCSLILLVTGVLSGLGMAFAPQIVALFAPGFGSGTDQAMLCAELTRVMMPYIIFVSLVALLNGALSSVHIFGVSSMAQVVMNMVLIAGALIAGFFGERGGVMILALSVVLGGAAQVLAQIPAARRAGFPLLPSREILTRPVLRILRLMLPAIAGATIYQISVFVNTVFASVLETGSVSWLFYADRLIQLPIGIFSIALASVLLPTLSRAASDDDNHHFVLNLSNSLRFTSFIIIPTACALFFFAKPIVIALFERGAFDRLSSIKTAIAVQAMALGIWSVSCHSMIVRAFIARKDTLTPTLVGGVTLVSSVFLSLMLMGKPEAGSGALYGIVAYGQAAVTDLMRFEGTLGHVGLALATTFGSFLSLGMLAVILHSRQPDMIWRPFLLATIKSFSASIAMLGTLYFVPLRDMGVLAEVLAGLPLAGILYLSFCALLRTHELGESLAALKRFSKRA